MSDLPARIRAINKLHGTSVNGGIGLNDPNNNNQPDAPPAVADENWRAFGNDNAAGRLLAKLYGGAYKPVVSYPVLKSKSNRNRNVEEGKVWKTTNKMNANESVQHYSRLKASTLSIPKPSQKPTPPPYPIDSISKKKNATSSRKMINDANMRTSAYRPAYTHAFSSDNEKDRLSEIFTYKGGKCLPEGMTNMAGRLPSEVVRGEREKVRVEEANGRRRVRLNGGVDPNANTITDNDNDTRQSSDPKEELFGQIYSEIVDRRDHQNAMEDSGAGVSSRKTTAIEINSRVKRLAQLNPSRAKTVLAELYA